jgi:hypothetical protein
MPRNYRTDPTHGKPLQDRKLDSQAAKQLSRFEATARTQGSLYNDVAAASPGLLSLAIERVAAKGGALLFGYTSDGGAASVVLYYGNDKKRYYASNPDDLADLLGELTLIA